MAVREGKDCRETQRTRVRTTAHRRSPHRAPTRQLSGTPHPVFVGCMNEFLESLIQRQGGLRGCGSQEDLPRPLVVRESTVNEIMEINTCAWGPGPKGNRREWETLQVKLE